jgi:hypothetical protein
VELTDGTIRISKSELEKLFSILKRDQKGSWKRKTEASKATGFSRPTIDKILRLYPQGMPQKPKLTQPQFVDKYEETLCHKKIVQAYTDRATGKLSSQGGRTDRFGLDLYLMFGQKDPCTLDLKQFLQAKDDPRFMDKKTGTIAFSELVALRTIMVFAGLDPKRYSKEFTTKGTKRPPQKKGWYLEEGELLRFIYGINEIETLVFCRIGIESGGRFSSTTEITTDKIAFDMNMIEMFEPKVSSTEERYFVPCTMEFIRQYIREKAIIGKLFRQSYESLSDKILEAGQRAGLFRFTGEYEEREIRSKGKRIKSRVKKHEGKLTSTHLLKHTFVSLSSMHGFGLDDVSEQTGTDPDTLKKFYLGVGKKKLKGIILGKIEYVPWHEWIRDTLHPHWQKRYMQLKAAQEEKP